MIVDADRRRAAQAGPNRPVAADRPLMFAYWGTTGGLPKLTLDLARMAAAQDDIRCTFSVSAANELFEHYAFLGDGLFGVRTFSSKWRCAVAWTAMRDLRVRLGERLRRDKTRALVSLMPHIWTPFMTSVVRRAGVRHLAIVHDADPHPGDRYALTTRWLLHGAAAADHVITLSAFVAHRLAARGIPEHKISVLFHPDLDYRAPRAATIREPHPLRLVFIGRLLPYKGLGLLVDAVEEVHSAGLSVELGVYGRGKIEPSISRRLSTLGATVVNRWVSHCELAHVLSHCDVVAATHTEASQSGIIAAAFGAGVPVISTPVGGIVEQVTHGVTGVVADSVTAHAVAAAVRKIVEDRGLLARLRQGIAATREERSMERFFQQVCAIARAGRPVRTSP